MKKKRLTFRDLRQGRVDLDIRRFTPRDAEFPRSASPGYTDADDSPGLFSRLKRRLQHLLRGSA